MAMTIAELQARLAPLIGVSHTLPITLNKGLTGILLEKLTGIPQTSNCLDCTDGELKTFPVKRLRGGQLVPKESLAVTMLSTEELRSSEYEAARCCKKMARMLVVPYLREGDAVKFLAPTLLDATAEAHAPVYAALKADYTEIRRRYLEDGTLKSEIGEFLQSRTKGAGHGSTSRAFYLRPEFMKRFIRIISE
jgi:DNA mismatch repair protein MutH